MSDADNLAKGGRVGREGRKREAGSGKEGKRDNLGAMDWPTRQRKGPKGIPWGVNKSFLGYRRTILARAESSMRRKQRAHKARKPKARRSSFTASPHWQGSIAPD